MVKLTIEVDKQEELPEVVAEVRRLVSAGYVEGYYPRWYITGDDGRLPADGDPEPNPTSE